FIERRGWKLIHPFEDVMSGRKTEKDRPGFAAMLKAAHQRKFDIVVFWALDRLTREGTRATLNYLQRLESKGVHLLCLEEILCFSQSFATPWFRPTLRAISAP